MNLLLFASIFLFFSLQKLLIIARLKMTSHYHYCEMKSYCFGKNSVELILFYSIKI